MPHYANGREAKLNDTVIGKGYNVKHPISGVIVGIKPGDKTCNVEVAHLKPRPTWGATHPQTVFPTVDVEYGQADAFLHVDDAKPEDLKKLLGL